ncbi:hypothetical protein PG994_011465 [Apiospora phragmitis]|uniref:Uncharacterized protein n=1 Tax=Apiospora phragmitis TaxID=2905665 RepID=A0ABR1TSV6_9PEZI
MVTIVHLDVSFAPSSGLARSRRRDKARVAGQTLRRGLCSRKETHMGDPAESPYIVPIPSLIDGSEEIQMYDETMPPTFNSSIRITSGGGHFSRDALHGCAMAPERALSLQSHLSLESGSDRFGYHFGADVGVAYQKALGKPGLGSPDGAGFCGQTELTAECT